MNPRYPRHRGPRRAVSNTLFAVTIKNYRDRPATSRRARRASIWPDPSAITGHPAGLLEELREALPRVVDQRSGTGIDVDLAAQVVLLVGLAAHDRAQELRIRRVPSAGHERS